MLTLLRDLRRSRRAIALPAPGRGRSLAVCHVDAGSCNGCEHELNQLASPYYDLQRYGLNLVASPRHADVLLVTGAVTSRMREPLLIAYAAMPEPRRVVALGDSALGRDLLGSSEEIVGPVEAILPVDLCIPGRPPTPEAILQALLSLIDQTRPSRRATRRQARDLAERTLQREHEPSVFSTNNTAGRRCSIACRGVPGEPSSE